MNPRTLSTTLTTSLAVAALTLLALRGPLNPPSGPVASTYKTLSEVEPRIAINATNTPGTASSTFVISQPGSYYLTANVTSAAGKRAIEITAPNVTLDLNGFTLSGSGSAAGIFVGAAGTRVNIRNGTIVGFGLDGIDAGFGSNASFERITAMNNGASSAGRYGIRVGSSMHLRDCIASSNTGGGISANDNCDLTDCSAVSNSGVGFNLGASNIVHTCNARSNAGTGFSAGDSDLFETCLSNNNTGSGFNVNNDATLSNCTAIANISDNIFCAARGLLTHCTANLSLTGSGINLSQVDCKATGCTADSNGVLGIRATSGSAVIEHCNCRSNTQTGMQIGGNSSIVGCIVANNRGNGILCDFGGGVQIIDNQLIQNGLGLSAYALRLFTGSDRCRVEHNTFNGNFAHLSVSSLRNVITRNTFSDDAGFSFSASNSIGPFLSANSSGDMTSTANSNHPQANFLH